MLDTFHTDPTVHSTIIATVIALGEKACCSGETPEQNTYQNKVGGCAPVCPVPVSSIENFFFYSITS